jgi:60 kDa SS-A/Ro ribonucleoprotein
MNSLIDGLNNLSVNSCGKEIYKLSPLEQLKRFLYLGTEGGTYYIEENDLTQINLESLESALSDERDRHVVLELIKDYSKKAFKKDYVIYVLARCCSFKEDQEFRKEAYSIMLDVCTIPTHLFMFLEFCEIINRKYNNSTGWNKIHKNFISLWYIMKPLRELVYQCTKYKNRNGWTHRDVFRLCHIRPLDTITEQIYGYFVKGKIPEANTDIPSIAYLIDYNQLKNTNDPDFVIEKIRKWNFVREHISTKTLKHPSVLNELARKMPMIALIRNLNRLTAMKVFDIYSSTLTKVILQLESKEHIRNSGVHPLQILIALKMYESGSGDLGNLRWKPIHSLIDALNTAFYNSFDNVVPTNKRILIALDISSSMNYNKCQGIRCLSAAEIGCAMAMVIKSREPTCDIVGFSDKLVPLNIDIESTMMYNLRIIYELNFGTTDISRPFIWATEMEKVYDAFIVITDNETNSNTYPPAQELRKYRSIMGVDSKLIVIAASANSFTIADPNDKGMLDISGFSADVPVIINEFLMD